MEPEATEPTPKARVITTTRDEIRTPAGDVAAIHVRRDFSDGTKAVHWERPSGEMGLGGKPVADLPLFGIHKLGTASTVFVVEGEKAAKALRKIGVAAVGTVTGATGCPSDDSLRPLLGRNLVLWPDHDVAGREHMDVVGRSLRRLGQKPGALWGFTWPDAPAKGDAHDFIARGGTKELLKEQLASARQWEPSTASETASAGASAAPGAAAGLTLDPPNQTTRLVHLARSGDAELFHDTTRTAYITFTANGHRETWPLHSRAVREWLSQRYFETEEAAPNGNAIKDALATLAGFAMFTGACREVFVRLANHEDDIFLDLGDDTWRVVKITADGWCVIPGDDAPVRFRRPRAMLGLPEPVHGGDLAGLRKLLNVADDDAFTLIVGWLLGTLNPCGSYPILVLHGEQGSAKTTAGRMLRNLIDPNVSPLRTQPRDEGDLLIAASGGLMVAYDNLSTIPDWLSDALCRLTSGGGLSKRQLFTDSDEIVLDARRPALLTGIESTLSRADALDRAVMVELEQIPKQRRRTEGAVAADFNAVAPEVLGVLLTAASTALRKLPTLHLTDLPRLADFARWIEAGSAALGWESGHFLAVYDINRASADDLAIEASPIGPALLAFVDEHDEWLGSASELLAALNERTDAAERKERGWPKQPRGLTGHLKRIAPNLRRLGIKIALGVRLDRHSARGIQIDAKDRPQRPQRPQSRNHADAGDTATVRRPPAHRPQALLARDENPRNDKDFRPDQAEADAADGADGDLPFFSQDALFVGVVAECRDCGAVVQGGQAYCFAHDPRGA